ncbi:centrosomal protein of 128 kDa isoform X2 [Pristis pectinata]|uniref:centrosomal protein of 128 kDa isoform X2 n=1 Tax=Pristis pectinata TaxID=685728 RepID=UPI00223CABB8|nr:centrosomal protein of 128 kDa isoform X2 [Pristis pectinata]
MADSSSDSDTQLHNFSRRRGSLNATARGRSRMHNAARVTEKIDTLASTLQDTSRDLKSVDRMLGQYRGYTNEQMEAVAQLRDNLEQSIDELRSQRLSRSAGISPLRASDLQGDSVAGRRYRPTSPLRDPGSYAKTSLRRSRSASVRFVDDTEPLNHVHSLHQSLRDLSSDQLRLGEEVDQEIARRNRTDKETRNAIDSLSERVREVSRTETVSERVERRLQEIEKEMRTERQLAEHRQDQLGQMAVQLQEELKKRDKIDEVEGVKSKLSKSQEEKFLIEQELSRTRRRLDQSEGSRETLVSQIDDLRAQLLKTEQERATLQHRILQSQQKSYREKDEDDRLIQAVAARSELEKQVLEKQILELRAQLNEDATRSEVGELRRSLERKEKEKKELSAHVEVLSSDLEKREKQQLRMLNQLQEIQKCYDDCMQDRKSTGLEIADLTRQLKESGAEAERFRAQWKEVELLRLESEKKKDELKVKAQESIRQWKVKCKKLERDVERQKEAVDQWMEQHSRVSKEKETLQGQHEASLQQMESLRRELNEVILKRVQQEEDVRRKDVELNELKSKLLQLDGELRDAKESLRKLDADLHEQCMLHVKAKGEKQQLEDELMALSEQHERDQEKLLEMQRVITELNTIRSELSTKLAQEESFKKEIRKSLSEAQARHTLAQEEVAALSNQLKLEKDAHRKELVDTKSEMQSLRTKHEKNMQEVLKQFQEERDKLENNLSVLKAEQAEEKNFAKAQRRQVEKMKTECNKLAEELIQGEAENAKLRRKYLVLKQELEAKGKLAVNGEECARQLEQMTFQLKDQITKVQTEQEMILCAIGKEIETACDFLSRDAGDKFKAITLTPGLENDPHRWLAEMKTKLQWLCEEVKERDGRELKLRSHLRQCRGQLKELMQSKESETELFIEQITKQEHLLEEIHREKRELLQKMCRKDEEMRALQVRYNDRIADLETSTQMALDHLESVPERLSMLDDIRDLEGSQHHRDMIEERYTKYKEIVNSLQQQLQDSTRRIQAHQVEESDTGLGIERLDDTSATLSDQNSFPSTCLTAGMCSPSGSSNRRRTQPPGNTEANAGWEFGRATNGRKSPAEKDKY